MTPPTKQFSIRLPTALVESIDAKATEQGTTRTTLIISLLQSALGDTVTQSVTQSSPTMGYTLSPTVTQSSPTPMEWGTVADLTEAVRHLTAQISQLATAPGKAPGGDTVATVQEDIPKPKKAKAATPTKPPPNNKHKTKTTRRVGAPAPVFPYNGKSGTIREHVIEALPELTPKQVDLARNNINRMICGRKDRPDTQKPIEEAFAHEIARWEKKLDLPSSKTPRSHKIH